MDIDTFIEGPLLKLTFLVLIFGASSRLALFIISILRRSKIKESHFYFTLGSMVRLLLPLHGAIRKRPLYVGLQSIFHLCLIIVPLWFSGHILLWSDSRFGWEWTAIPDALADWMTLALLMLAAVFLIRRLVIKELRLEQAGLGYLLIIITALPFLSGYLLAHGTLDHIAFFKANLDQIHILSSELMIVMAAFLFCVPCFHKKRCIGCAACEEHCPTGAIQASDQGNSRTFHYAFRPCIHCAACVDTCPEDAAVLRHEMSFRKLFQKEPLETLLEIPMQACERCGALFATEPQLHKVFDMIEMDHVRVCPRCRSEQIRERLTRH